MEVRKRSGDREPFVAGKVRGGIELAVKGRPVTSEQVTRMVTSVEDAVRASSTPLETSSIGELVLTGLKVLDPVSAMRFASVYKHFEELSDFERAASELSGP